MHTEARVRRFPLQVGDSIHQEIENALAKSILKSKHQWIEKAIEEKLARDNRAV